MRDSWDMLGGFWVEGLGVEGGDEEGVDDVEEEVDEVVVVVVKIPMRFWVCVDELLRDMSGRIGSS